MNIRVFYHDKCFDGACSASLFARFHRECIGTAASYDFHGLVHRAGALFNENDFTGDENAIVDFKYSASPRITWWFDHHLSAFLTPEDQAHYLQGQQDGSQTMRKFYDPHYTSCTSLIAHIASTKFGFDAAPLAELVKWADIVDGARYESAESAVEMAAPAMKLTMVIESTQDDTLVPRLIPLLTSMSLQAVLDQPFVQELLPPLLERHEQSVALIRQRSSCEQGTIYFDITDHPTEGYNKFIPYYLHPEATYNVGLSKSSFRTKVAVGSNPWTKQNPDDMVNLATICERYGGGGHARVGAISFSPEKADLARQAAAEIVAELRAHEEALASKIASRQVSESASQ
ncbi:MAG: phosphoesterase [Acidobacteriaceae bacterium]